MAFRRVPVHLQHAIRTYHRLPPLRGHVIATWTLSFRPLRMAVSPDDEVLVIDSDSDFVHVFSSQGVFLRRWRVYDGYLPYTSAPNGIAVARTGEVVITDCLDNRVLVFRANGTLVRAWGSEGHGNRQFKFPRGVAVSQDGLVLVTDIQICRVQVFRLSDGAFVRKWNTRQASSVQHDPRAVCVAPNNEVVVIDHSACRVQVFAPNGVLLRQWGSPGLSPGQLGGPWGVALRGSDVVVSDRGRVQVFRPDGTPVMACQTTAGCSEDRWADASQDVAVLRSGQVLVCLCAGNRIHVLE